jgi:diguanylate cyclase (GGDEF)-like protein
MNDPGTIRYVALIEVNDCLVEAGLPVDAVSWLDADFVESFEEELDRSFVRTRGRVSVGGVEYPDCDVFAPTLSGADYHYVRTDALSVPSVRAEADLVRSRSLRVSSDGLDDILDSVAQSEEFYLNLRTMLSGEYVLPYCEIEGDGERRILSTIKLLEFPRLLIVGAPGSGKTSIVRKLAFDCARIIKQKRRSDLPIPVYVRLRQFYNRIDDISLYMEDIAHRLGKQYFVSSLYRGRLLFIFDGFDELKLADRNAFFSWCNRFEDELPAIRIIITSRELTASQMERLSSFRKMRILPFERDQQFELCQTFLGSASRAQHFFVYLDQSVGILSFLSNPLSLNLALAVYMRRALLPHNVGDLVRVVVDYLLGLWDESRGVERDRILNPRMTRSVLGRVAYEAQRQGIVEFQADVAREVLPAKLGDLAPSDVFDEIAFATGLLERSERGWHFAHRYFQDFFCASFLMERLSGLRGEFSNRKTEKFWINVWRKVGQLCSEPEFFSQGQTEGILDAEYKVDRVLFALLAQEGANKKQLKRLVESSAEGLVALEDGIETVAQVGDTCSVVLRKRADLDLGLFSRVIANIGNLREPKYSNIVDALLSARKGQKLGHMIGFILGCTGPLSTDVRGRHVRIRERVTLTSGARMRHQAGHDALTGLPNRVMFRDCVDHALTRARRSNSMVAVLLLDLDRFKGVNDAFGLHAGDELLQGVARRLRGCLPDTDPIARLGGDEFAVLQSEVRGPDDARTLARRLSECFAEPFSIAGEELRSSVSIGITLFPADGQAADRLLKNAELAMYGAKANGRQTTCFFAPQMSKVARRTGVLERELRQAFASDQFTVHYQPQRALATGEIVGVEALLRWRHPRRGMVRPSEFIALSEEIGLIAPLTERVLERACRQLRTWQSSGLPALRLSMNMSPVQLREPGIAALIEGTLAETGLDPTCLELELTEGVMLEDNDVAMASLRRLHKQGVSFSLDDFGTGYSSFAYVKRFPVQRLKIDQSFVHRLAQNRQDEAIVRAIIELGHSLGLKITAEGVDTVEQLQHLEELGCDEAQGDLISPPLPAEAFQILFSQAVSSTARA